MLSTFSMNASSISRVPRAVQYGVVHRRCGTHHWSRFYGAPFRCARAAPCPGHETEIALPSLSSQINFNHALIRRDLIDGAFGQHRAFVQAGHLDAEGTV